MGELPSWWAGKAVGRRQNARSRAQEREHAKRTGGRVQPGSGSSYRAKEDVKTPDHLDQLKYTDAASFTIRAAELSKLFRNAVADGREGRMIVRFEGRDLTVVIAQHEE